MRAWRPLLHYLRGWWPRLIDIHEICSLRVCVLSSHAHTHTDNQVAQGSCQITAAACGSDGAQTSFKMNSANSHIPSNRSTRTAFGPRCREKQLALLSAPDASLDRGQRGVPGSGDTIRSHGHIRQHLQTRTESTNTAWNWATELVTLNVKCTKTVLKNMTVHLWFSIKRHFSSSIRRWSSHSALIGPCVADRNDVWMRRLEHHGRVRRELLTGGLGKMKQEREIHSLMALSIRARLNET